MLVKIIQGYEWCIFLMNSPNRRRDLWIYSKFKVRLIHVSVRRVYLYCYWYTGNWSIVTCVYTYGIQPSYLMILYDIGLDLYYRWNTWEKTAIQLDWLFNSGDYWIFEKRPMVTDKLLYLVNCCLVINRFCWIITSFAKVPVALSYMHKKENPVGCQIFLPIVFVTKPIAVFRKKKLRPSVLFFRLKNRIITRGNAWNVSVTFKEMRLERSSVHSRSAKQ